jgi:membrane-bound ClpP family serine protease
VVLEINTFGGRVDAANVRDALLGAKVPVVRTNQRAISAGALISLAAQHASWRRGRLAAAPVLAGQPGAGNQAVSEKTVS